MGTLIFADPSGTRRTWGGSRLQEQISGWKEVTLVPLREGAAEVERQWNESWGWSSAWGLRR